MTGRSKLIVLEPRITRAFWSKRRAWQGDVVKLYVETKHVPDGASVKFEIWEDGTDERTGDEFLLEIPGTHTIEKGRCEVEHTLAFDPDTLGEDLELEGNDWELYFVARIDAPAITARSGLLYVDLQPLIVSI
jgi:hypothetical protein